LQLLFSPAVCLEVATRRHIGLHRPGIGAVDRVHAPAGFLHGLVAGIAPVAAGFGVDGAAGDRRPIDVVGAHFDVREAVVLAVDCREEVHDKGEDVADVD